MTKKQVKDNEDFYIENPEAVLGEGLPKCTGFAVEKRFAVRIVLLDDNRGELHFAVDGDPIHTIRKFKLPSLSKGVWFDVFSHIGLEMFVMHLLTAYILSQTGDSRQKKGYEKIIGDDKNKGELRKFFEDILLTKEVSEFVDFGDMNGKSTYAQGREPKKGRWRDSPSDKTKKKSEKRSGLQSFKKQLFEAMEKVGLTQVDVACELYPEYSDSRSKLRDEIKPYGLGWKELQKEYNRRKMGK